MPGCNCDHCRLLGNVTRPVRRGPQNGPVGRRPDAGKKGDAKRRPADPMCPDEDDLEQPGTSVPIAAVTRNTRRRITGCHLLRSSLVQHHWIMPEETRCSPVHQKWWQSTLIKLKIKKNCTRSWQIILKELYTVMKNVLFSLTKLILSSLIRLQRRYNEKGKMRKIICRDISYIWSHVRTQVYRHSRVRGKKTTWKYSSREEESVR